MTVEMPAIMPFEQWKVENVDLLDTCEGAPCEDCFNGEKECPTCGHECICETCGGSGLVDCVTESDAERALRKLYEDQLAQDRKRWAEYEHFLQEIAA